MSKSNVFYAEFIALTIVSLVAANLWSRYINDLLNKRKSIRLDLFAAILATIIAYTLMDKFFSIKQDVPMSKDGTEKYKNKDKKTNKYGVIIEKTLVNDLINQ